ncbi:MAG: hypothetical protein AAF518_12505 [Spirochaetota bacterium]
MKYVSFLVCLFTLNCTLSYHVTKINEGTKPQLAKPLRLVVTYETKLKEYEKTIYRPLELSDSLASESLGGMVVDYKRMVRLTKINVSQRFQGAVYYQPFRTEAEYQSFEKKNCIFLRLFKKKDIARSFALAVLTLGVIPGVMSDSVVVEATIYDAQGNAREEMMDLGRVEQTWVGWLFFFWGPLVSVSNESSVNIAIQNSIPWLLQQSNTDAVK